MPAARQGRRATDQLLNAVKPVPLNPILSVDKYLRSADLLISQANQYRIAKNEAQLYVLLMRFASLVVETLPKHKDFTKANPKYKRLEALLVTDVFPELDRLKLSLNTKEVPDTVLLSTSRPTDAVRLQTSNLPQINWGEVVTPQGPASAFQPLPASAPSFGLGPQAALYGGDALDFLGSAPPPGVAATSTSGSGVSAAATAAAAYTPSVYAASQGSLTKHALFAPRQLSQTRMQQRPVQPRYPEFDRSPAPSLDGLFAPSAPVAPPEVAAQVAALSLIDAPMPAQPLPPPGLDPQFGDPALQLPPPSAGPTLGPQEVQVFSQDPGAAVPDTCCTPSPDGTLAAPGGPDAVGGSVKQYAKKAELRDVHISVALMEEFLHYAQTNTRKGIESCGILSGILSANDSTFTVTTLIIPKQEGTTDTVTALNEEDIYEAQASRELYPMGWIHTHPTQTCFMSSVDVHTQCGYQTMLYEAVAIVMAPTDRKNKCGIFRLTTPGGLSLVQKCGLRGFHTHPPTSTGQELYELCGHVFLNPRAKHSVIDLR